MRAILIIINIPSGWIPEDFIWNPQIYFPLGAACFEKTWQQIGDGEKVYLLVISYIPPKAMKLSLRILSWLISKNLYVDPVVRVSTRGMLWFLCP